MWNSTLRNRGESLMVGKSAYVEKLMAVIFSLVDRIQSMSFVIWSMPGMKKRGVTRWYLTVFRMDF
jgi:hypothetical protein